MPWLAVSCRVFAPPPHHAGRAEAVQIVLFPRPIVNRIMSSDDMEPHHRTPLRLRLGLSHEEPRTKKQGGAPTKAPPPSTEIAPDPLKPELQSGYFPVSRTQRREIYTKYSPRGMAIHVKHGVIPSVRRAFQQPTDNCSWLTVPFDRRELAKKLGARWDPLTKLWYCPAGKNLAPFVAAGFRKQGGAAHNAQTSPDQSPNPATSTNTLRDSRKGMRPRA